jgi:hypothetical protein
MMSSYTTVGELIEHLKGEDLEAPIIYQYYLAEHFEISEEVFAEVARDFDSLIPCSDSYEVISREINSKNICDECGDIHDEPENKSMTEREEANV